MSAPERIETERLVLRRPEPKDVETWVRFGMSERMRYIDEPMNRGDSWRHVSKLFGHWAILGFGLWSVTRHGEDRSIGMVGPYRPDDWPEGEIGWTVLEEAEGQGIAFEAAVAARAEAYAGLGWPTAVSYIDPENARSIRLAERLGAVRDDAAPLPEGWEPGDALVYRHPAPEVLR